MRPAYAIGRCPITGAYGLVGCPERQLTNIRGQKPRLLVKNWPRCDGVGKYGRSRGRALARNRRVVETSCRVEAMCRPTSPPAVSRPRRALLGSPPGSVNPSSLRPLPGTSRKSHREWGYRSTTRRYTPYGISGTGSPQALAPSVVVATCSSRTRRA